MSAGAPLSARRLDEIASRAADLCEYSVSHGAEVDALAGEDVPALLAEVFRLRAELTARPTRAERLRHAADGLTAACPDRSDADEVWMDCPCEWADELRRMAATAEGGGPS